jgi:hypothetical protein
MIQFDDFCSLLSHYIAIPRHCNDASGVTEDEVININNEEDSAKAKDISLLISQHIWEFLEFS